MAALFFFWAYAVHDPAVSTHFPKCPFYAITGLKCPGCGTQRAIHQLLHFNISEAFHYNALMVLSLPLLLFLAFADLSKDRFPRFYRASRSPILGRTILAVILLWWIARNIFQF